MHQKNLDPLRTPDMILCLELLFEHKVGIKERPTILYEIDEDYLKESSDNNYLSVSSRQ